MIVDNCSPVELGIPHVRRVWQWPAEVFPVVLRTVHPAACGTRSIEAPEPSERKWSGISGPTLQIPLGSVVVLWWPESALKV